MTSQKDIQSLIADIDSILPKVGSRLHWSNPGDAGTQRRILERVRSYLVSQQQHGVTATETPTPPTLSEQPALAQQVVQAVAREINGLRVDLMESLRDDVEALRQQRESLVQEIQQLERTRQQLESHSQQTFAQQQTLSDFSQELIHRCTESSTQQLTQILREWEARLVSTESIPVGSAPNATELGTARRVLQPRERLEHLQQLQVQFDHLLITLDTNHRTIFEALQRSIQSYQESLSQGLEKMHGMGIQAEMLFAALIDRLMQQVGRDASISLQSPPPPSDSVHQTSPATYQSALETQLPTGVAQLLHVSGTSSQESLLETPNSGEWDIVEGSQSDYLDIDLDDDNDIDTFIQLDIEPQPSPSSVEPESRLPDSDSQEFDPLVDTVNETSPTSSAAQSDVDEAAEHEASSDDSNRDDLDTIRASTDSSSSTNPSDVAQALFPPFPAASPVVRKEIFDLYESLFGTNSLSDRTPVDELPIVTPQFPEASPVDGESDASEVSSPTDCQPSERVSPIDSVTPLASQVEEVLFEGLADPAIAPSQEQVQNGSAEPWVESWEALFFEDSASRSPSGVNGVKQAHGSLIAINSPSNWETASPQEMPTTIGRLTDLFEEMGLSGSLSVADAASMPVTTEQPVEEYHPSDSSVAQARLDEEEYPPASANENLLATDELTPEPELEIQLEQSILQQLQQDLHKFEEPQSEAVPTREESQPPTGSPETPQMSQPDQWFPMSEELLAEDWEEFGFSDFSSEDSAYSSWGDAATTDLSNQESTPSNTERDAARDGTRDESSGTSLPAVESDFDPDLFPSETLELTPEGAVSETVTGELVTLEDEPFVEMLWDEPIDSTTEEIAASSELESGSDSSCEEMLDFQQEDVVLEAGTEDLPHWDAQATSELNTDDSESFSEERLDFQQENVALEVGTEELAHWDNEATNELNTDNLSQSDQDATLSQQGIESANSGSQDALNCKPKDEDSDRLTEEELARLEALIASEEEALNEDDS